MTYIETIEALQTLRDEAASMTASCPICERSDRKVREQILQATRQRPAKFLGFQGFCVDCQMAFPLETAQLALV